MKYVVLLKSDPFSEYNDDEIKCAWVAKNCKNMKYHYVKLPYGEKVRVGAWLSETDYVVYALKFGAERGK